MKKGLFILVTNAAPLLDAELACVYEPQGLTEGLAPGVRAVILDAALADSDKLRMAQACAARRIPFLYWAVPADLQPHGEMLTQEILALLREQNDWWEEPPQPRTVADLEMQTLVEIITTANAHLEPGEVMRSVMERIQRVIPCEAWSVLMLEEPDRDCLYFAAAFGPGSDHLQDLTLPVGQGIAGWCFQHRQPLVVNNVRKDRRFFDQIDKSTAFETRSILCAPLISRGRPIGVIEMLNKKQAHFNDSDLDLVKILVNPAAVAIENAFLFQKSERLTITDDLTQLYNSRYLNRCIETEVKRAERTGQPFSILFLDLDGFKSINDSYGHPQGSQSLVEVAGIIRQASRDVDIVGRYGGDEFVLILPNTDQVGAIKVAERIRNHIEEYILNEIQLTASIGIASYPEHGLTKKALVRAADTAMYRVKDRGKNGILVADTIVS